MTTAMTAKLTSTQLADYGALFGEAPILNSENRQHYKAMFANLIESLAPSDFMELMLVEQLFNETWLLIRYGRHRTVVVERRYRESSKFLAKRQAELKAGRQKLAEELAQKALVPVTEFSELVALEDSVTSVVDDIDAINGCRPIDVEHNRALEASMEFLQQLDSLINAAHRRRNDALQQLDLYRQGLGRRWREISDDIIDAEVAEIQSLPTQTGVQSSVTAVAPVGADSDTTG